MFTGERYVVALNGSFNGSPNLSDVPAGQFVEGSRNGNTLNNGFEKRGGTETIGSQIAASLQSLGGAQLIKRSTLTKHTYFAGADGELYRDGVSIVSSRSTTEYSHFTAADDRMFICNGVNDVKVDTGSAVATITSPPADWTGSAHPVKMIIHTKGGSRRMFAWGVNGKETTLYYSSTGNFQEFTGGSSGNVVVDFRHGEGIIDCISKDGTLWIFGKDETYILDDTDSDKANWGVQRASFKGGVNSPRLTTVARNAIFAMSTDGDIYEVQTAEQYRDFSQASIAIPFFIKDYIRRNWDLTKINQFHMNYEPVTDSLRIFGVRLGQTVVDECLVYYISQAKWAPPHDARDNNTGNNSGLKASVSFLAEDSSGDMRLYTQDYNGYTWNIETPLKADNSMDYTATALLPWLDLDLPGLEKRFAYAVLHYKSIGDYEVSIQWSVDGAGQFIENISLTPSGAALDSFILDTDTLGLIGFSEEEFDLGEIGRTIRFEISNSNAGEDFFLSELYIAFQNRGLRRK